MKRFLSAFLVVCILISAFSFDFGTPEVLAVTSAGKTSSTFYPASVLSAASQNIQANTWGEAIKQQQISNAALWFNASYDTLWEAIFPSTLMRSWFCTNNSTTCPDCGATVGAADWRLNYSYRFKLFCPHCNGAFPKNDFEAYYNSGLDSNHVFQYSLANSALLENANDGSQNLVDDGTGVVINGQRHYFIAHYLLRFWTAYIVNGVKSLANAYVVTGNIEYARRAAILLDRIADVYPGFDFLTQGVIYDGQASSTGSVGYWDETNETIGDLIIAYDMIFDAIENDTALIQYLNGKSSTYSLASKSNITAIRNNIEQNIFVHTLNNPALVHRNFPMQEIVLTKIKAVLNYDYYTSTSVDGGSYDGTGDGTFDDGIYETLNYVLQNAIANDGLTGEKGIVGYSAKTTVSTWTFISLLNMKNTGLIQNIVNTNSNLVKGIDFYINLWANETYYPYNGDGGQTFKPTTEFPLYTYISQGIEDPSLYTFLYNVYKATGNTSYLQLAAKLIGQNKGNSYKSFLPYDIFVTNLSSVNAEINSHLNTLPEEINQTSQNFSKWHFATLTSGTGENKRYIMLDYDSGGSHAHSDAMNIYLFANKAEYLADFGYPPINYIGGWQNDYIYWYRHPLAHNTVTVGGSSDIQIPGIFGNVTLQPYGEITNWGVGDVFKTMLASSSGYTVHQFDRSLSLIDIDEESSYVLDLFRVSSGGAAKKLTKSVHSNVGSLSTSGLNFTAGGSVDSNVLVSNLYTASGMNSGWSADFTYSNANDGGATQSGKYHLLYTDLTNGLTSVIKGDAVAVLDGQGNPSLVTIPTLLLNKNAEKANFVAVLEPNDGGYSKILKIERMTSGLTDLSGNVAPDCDVAVKVLLKNGLCDYIIQIDHTSHNTSATKTAFKVADWNIESDAETVFVRLDAKGELVYISFTKGTYVKYGNTELRAASYISFHEHNYKEAVKAEKEDDEIVAAQSEFSKTQYNGTAFIGNFITKGVSFVSGEGVFGDGAAKLSSEQGGSNWLLLRDVPLKAGKSYRIRISYKITSASSASYRVALQDYTDETKTKYRYIFPTAPINGFNKNAVASVSSGYTEFVYDFTVPSTGMIAPQVGMYVLGDIDILIDYIRIYETYDPAIIPVYENDFDTNDKWNANVPLNFSPNHSNVDYLNKAVGKGVGGSDALYLKAPASGYITGNIATTYINTPYIPVTEGKTYLVKMRYKFLSASTNASGHFFFIQNSPSVNTPNGAGLNYSYLKTLVSSDWQTFSYYYTIPAGVTKIRFGMMTYKGTEVLIDNMGLYLVDTNEADRYTLSFDANGGSGEMSSETYYEDAFVYIKTNSFTRSSYTFAGWNTEADGSGIQYPQNSILNINENMTLYAQWTTSARTVTYNANGGQGINHSEIYPNGFIHSVKGQIFAKSGYAFAGWNTETDGSGTSYEAGSNLTLSSNVTLYAQWRLVETFTVSFNANGGNGTMSQLTSYDLSPVTLPANTFTRTDCVFLGWNTAMDGSGMSFMSGEVIVPAFNMTLYAQWGGTKILLYEIDFDSASHWNGNIPNNFPSDPADGTRMCKAIGQGIAGTDAWKLDADGSYAYANCPILTIQGNKTYRVSCKYKVVEAGNMFFYVQWVQNGVSGTQYVDGMTWGSNEFLNGGYVSMPVSADFQTFEYIYHAPSDANGLRFGPCVSGNTVLLIDDMKIEELKGVLTSDIASVTFAAADNSVSSVVKQYVKGETVTLSADILTKNGYEISFFEVVSGANTYTKNVGDTFVVTGNVTIKVNFIEKTRYTISYNSNGGIGSMESKTLYYDEPFTIPSCTYTKDKNEFTMWNESPLGNGAAYSAGEEIFLSHNIVLYALWKQTKFEVTLKAEGGNIVLGGGIYDKNDSVTLVASGNDGCIFLGWFINGAGSAVSTELSYTVKVENDVYYVAKFLNENLNTLTYLDVSLGGGKVSYSSYGKSGTWNSSIQKYGFSKGKQITLVAEANKDYTFVHWRDQKTGKVVSENATYSFILGSDVSLVALFVKSDSKYVVFLDRLGKVLKASGTMFGSIKAPTVNNTYIGYVFTGWDKSFDNVNGILVVNALYNKDETMYNVNVFGGYINRDSSKVSGSYLYDTRITVNAKVPTGKYFAGWSFDGGETIASYNESYSFNVGSDCSLTAVFSDTEVQEKPVIAITSMTRRWSEGVEKQQATFLSQWNVPNDCSIVESGFLRTLKSGYRENLSLEFADEINVKKTTSVRKVSTGQYQLNVNITDPLNKTVYIRAYLTYVENSTGKVVTIYSNCAVSTPVL